MSKLKFTETDEAYLHQCEEAFLEARYPANAEAISTKLTALAESRRGDRFETVGDTKVSRPVIRIIVQILEHHIKGTNVEPDKLMQFARDAFPDLWAKLPASVPDETWAPRRKTSKDYTLNLADLPKHLASSALDDQPEPAFYLVRGNHYKAVEGWLVSRRDPEAQPWGQRPWWMKIMVAKLPDNNSVPGHIRDIFQAWTADSSTIDEEALTTVEKWLASEVGSPKFIVPRD